MIGRLVGIFLWGALALSAADVSYGNATLTGCLDEQPGPQYVLRGLNQLKLIAKLEPEGFPVQAFAKYLGRRVRVKGMLSSGSEPAVMRVKTIQALSGPCAPPEEKPKEPVATGKPEIKTLSGCIDQQPGPKYVLRGRETRELRAELEPSGFAVQNFARFLGHSVSITGELFAERNPPLLRIRNLSDIRDVSDICASR